MAIENRGAFEDWKLLEPNTPGSAASRQRGTSAFPYGTKANAKLFAVLHQRLGRPST